ncbi:smg-9, nonsense mediated mRNA decay factor [Chytridiales sp. JEL 0842]|nr:smg-9, nonsense mediated mRNA decay factor [Chytridiales sp. JEL 0842]
MNSPSRQLSKKPAAPTPNSPQPSSTSSHLSSSSSSSGRVNLQHPQQPALFDPSKPKIIQRPQAVNAPPSSSRPTKDERKLIDPEFDRSLPIQGDASGGSVTLVATEASGRVVVLKKKDDGSTRRDDNISSGKGASSTAVATGSTKGEGGGSGRRRDRTKGTPNRNRQPTSTQSPVAQRTQSSANIASTPTASYPPLSNNISTNTIEERRPEPSGPRTVWNPGQPSKGSSAKGPPVPLIKQRSSGVGSVIAGAVVPKIAQRPSTTDAAISPSIQPTSSTASVQIHSRPSTSTSTHTPSAPPLMKSYLKLIDANLKPPTDSSNILKWLSDLPGCYIIGVIGRKGVGKSTILNYLASNPSGVFPTSPSNSSASPGFGKPMSSFGSSQGPSGSRLSHIGTTLGVDLHLTPENIVLLDCQPLSSLRTSAPKTPSASGSLIEGGGLLVPEQLGVFMLSVCHVLLVVSEGRDDELWGFLRRVEAVKYRADGGTGEIITEFGKRRSRRRRRGKSGDAWEEVGEREEDDVKEGDDGKEEEESMADSSTAKKVADPANSQKTPNNSAATTEDSHIFFPQLVFVSNKASPADFSPTSHDRLKDAIGRAFKGTRMRVSGVCSMGERYGQYRDSSNDNTFEPNLWILPKEEPDVIFPNTANSASSKPTEHQPLLIDHLASLSKPVLDSYLAKSTFLPARPQILIKNLRNALLNVPRGPLYISESLVNVLQTPPPSPQPRAQHLREDTRWFQVSEREWYNSAVGIWATIRDGSLVRGLMGDRPAQQSSVFLQPPPSVSTDLPRLSNWWRLFTLLSHGEYFQQLYFLLAISALKPKNHPPLVIWKNVILYIIIFTIEGAFLGAFASLLIEIINASVGIGARDLRVSLGRIRLTATYATISRVTEMFIYVLWIGAQYLFQGLVVRGIVSQEKKVSAVRHWIVVSYLIIPFAAILAGGFSLSAYALPFLIAPISIIYAIFWITSSAMRIVFARKWPSLLLTFLSWLLLIASGFFTLFIATFQSSWAALLVGACKLGYLGAHYIERDYIGRRNDVYLTERSMSVAYGGTITAAALLGLVLYYIYLQVLVPEKRFANFTNNDFLGTEMKPTESSLPTSIAGLPAPTAALTFSTHQTFQAYNLTTTTTAPIPPIFTPSPKAQSPYPAAAAQQTPSSNLFNGVPTNPAPYMPSSSSSHTPKMISSQLPPSQLTSNQDPAFISKALGSIPTKSWTTGNVAQWLQSQGFNQTIQTLFIENGIDGEALLSLSDTHLKTYFNLPLGDMIKLSSKLEILQSSSSVAAFGAGEEEAPPPSYESV